MNCQHIKTHFPDFLTGDLVEDKKNEIQAHIAACASCRDELESLSAVWTKLGVLPEELPSPTLRTRFYSMLESHQNQKSGSARRRGIVQRLQAALKPLPFTRPALQLSLSLAFLFIGLATGFIFTNGKGRSAEISRLHLEVRNMRHTLAASLLERSSAVDRLQGINLSYSLEKPDSGLLEALLEAVNTDQNINVRLAAVESLYFFYDSPVISKGIVDALSQQTSPLVQVALIDLVVNMRERRAIETLRNLIANGTLDPNVKQRAELGLQKIGM